MSLRPTHSRAEAPIPAPQHVMVQADKAFKEAIQMRSSGWSPDSKGPASTGETGFGIQPGPEGRPHERKPRGGPSGDSWTSGRNCPRTSVGSAVQTRADGDCQQGSALWKEPPQDGPASQSQGS